jgi:hypothetical protein
VLRATGVVLRTGLSVLMPASNNRISTLPGGTVDRCQPPIQRNVRQNSVTGGAEGKKRPEEKPVLPENSYHTLSCRQPFIMMMWATGFWILYYLSKVWQLHRSRFSTVHPQRQMRAPAMIIFEIAHQNSFQMTIAQHDNMIQAILPRTPDFAPEIIQEYQAVRIFGKDRTFPGSTFGERDGRNAYPGLRAGGQHAARCSCPPMKQAMNPPLHWFLTACMFTRKRPGCCRPFNKTLFRRLGRERHI